MSETTLQKDDQAISETATLSTEPIEKDDSAPRKYFVFDTETSGMFDFKLPADDPIQPRLAQFAGIVTDETFEIHETINLFVYPDRWEMSEEAGKVNGLTTAILKERGVPVSYILDRYNELIDQGHVMVAFNAQFDCKMMRSELRRAERPDRFEETRNICVMRAAKKDMEFPGRSFPKLIQACEHYGITLENAHEAGADAMAAFEIFKILKARGALPEPKVHYAKNPPAGK